MVLTGGASTRMGRDKALLEVGGRALALVAATALRGAGAARVLAVGGDQAGLASLGLDVVADAHPGAGPLGGILTALEEACSEEVVVLACDLPDVDAASVRLVLDALRADPTAAVAWPEQDGRLHVLHAAWRTGLALPALSAAFAAGERSVRRAASTLPTTLVTGVTRRALLNANRPDDLRSSPSAAAGATAARGGGPVSREGHDGGVSNASAPPEVDATALAAAHRHGAVVLDVRQPEEYAAGHVPGALLIPLDQLGSRLDEVPRGVHLYVICKSGARSATAVEALTAAGCEATNVAGGTLAWVDAGFPTVLGPDAGER